jgi:hypothetical protein
MKAIFFVTFNQRGTVTATKRAPNLRSGEFAVRLQLQVPEAFFKPEIPTVDLTIRERDMILPVVVVDGEQQPQETP